MTRHVAIYLNSKSGADLGLERAACSALAASLGWSVMGVYKDAGLSAFSGTRPRYERLLADMAAGRVGAVIAWDLSRLHRRPADLERFVEAVEASGVAVWTCTAGELDLSTPSGRMVALLAVAP